MNLELLDLIVGTAGHIDHGKTALVRALTGTDADRLPEEKRRGITIDLGFAELDLGDARIGFVDVPGHERFVKNMLAGAHGIDVVALVIAADEGVMPQTREHFEICRLLETKTGLIVLTKIDLVDEELLEIVKLDAAELVQNSFLENAPIATVSAKTGQGIETLKSLLAEIARKIPARRNETVPRLPVDRAFSVKGFGTVVTGTLLSGEINEGEEMELLPAGRRVRVRGLQTHGKAVNRACTGQRAAINLGGIDHSEIERGDVLAAPDALRPTQIFDAEAEILRDASRSLKTRQRVRVHIGAAEVLARVQVLESAGEIAPGEKGFVQLRLETPIVAVPNERFIIRSYSPQRTIAGGKLIDGLAAKHRRKNAEIVRNRLQKWLAAETGGDKAAQLHIFLETAGNAGATRSDLQARTAWLAEILDAAIAENLRRKSIVQAENRFLARTPFDRLAAKTLDEIKEHHRREPLARGILRETLREKVFADLPPEIFRAVLTNLETAGKVAAEKDVVRIASHDQRLSPEDAAIREKIERIYQKSKLEVPTLDQVLSEAIAGSKTTKEQARKVFQLFLDAGELVRVTPEFYFRSTDLNALIEKMRSFAAEKTADRMIDVATFKDLAGVSRKYAIPLLEYFDREKLTRRAGEKRLVL
ncbi:MAG: selenocysteine-specific translation elongation factor [Acidobacteriota bacterium]|nr:selenocysteine-specific translation elongation factor [Acidobacteriota bacterium]